MRSSPSTIRARPGRDLPSGCVPCLDEQFACRKGLPGYCAEARRIKFGGRLRDGRAPFSEKVSGGFFQQSAFATHALATEGNIVKIPDDLPPESPRRLPAA
jgi:Zn-dependent alcohol dehydrogenase